MIARTFYFTTRLEIRNESDPRPSDPSGIALKSFQCTKLLGSRARALRDASAAAPWRSEVNWRRRLTALRRPPRLAPTQEHPHRRRAPRRTRPQPHTHTHSHARTRHTRSTPTDKQHKNTTSLCNCTYKHTNVFLLLCVWHREETCDIE